MAGRIGTAKRGICWLAGVVGALAVSLPAAAPAQEGAADYTAQGKKLPPPPRKLSATVKFHVLTSGTSTRGGATTVLDSDATYTLTNLKLTYRGTHDVLGERMRKYVITNGSISVTGHLHQTDTSDTGCVDVTDGDIQAASGRLAGQMLWNIRTGLVTIKAIIPYQVHATITTCDGDTIHQTIPGGEIAPGQGVVMRVRPRSELRFSGDVEESREEGFTTTITTKGKLQGK
jgi:hypothetical protein